ncbi:MAG: AAA family ATPase [Butyricicoccus sp.]|nr:AAA family ATPase [Butyricicoccus sp.]
MKKLILVCGDLATGKSTFCGQLSRRFDIPVFYKDTIKEVLGDTIGFADRAENLRLSGATFALLRHIFLQFADLGHDLILESNFRGHELDEMRSLAAAHGYAVLVLVLRADLTILHRRYLHRISDENRHPVHRVSTFNSFEGFCAYVESTRPQLGADEALHICADDFSYQSDETLLGQLELFLTK